MRLINNINELLDYVDYAKGLSVTSNDEFIVFIREDEYRSYFLDEFENFSFPFIVNWDQTEDRNYETHLYFSIDLPVNLGLITKEDQNKKDKVFSIVNDWMRENNCHDGGHAAQNDECNVNAIDLVCELADIVGVPYPDEL